MYEFIDINDKILERYPNLEIPYEAITYKEIPTNYNICFAIPQAKKYVIWFTFYKNENVCLLMELNRNKKISNISIIPTKSNKNKLNFGTILLGSLMTNPTKKNDLFIIEDILMYNGINLHKIIFGEKMGFIEDFLNYQSKINGNISFLLPTFWASHDEFNNTTEIPLLDIPYPLHHIQYRSLTNIVPYFNVFLGVSGILPWKEIQINLSPEMSCRKLNNNISNNLLIRQKKIFEVVANLQNDIYHLFAYDNIYYDIAYIPNYKSSVYMNSLFRNIKENSNLDFIEESDDDEDFEDIRQDKYVDLSKKIIMECVFHNKFRRWVPIKVVHDKIVHIDNLPKLYIS
jgi:hypothetical protein